MGEYSPGDANFPRGGDGRPTYSPSEVGFQEDGRYDSRFSLFTTLKTWSSLLSLSWPSSSSNGSSAC